MSVRDAIRRRVRARLLALLQNDIRATVDEELEARPAAVPTVPAADLDSRTIAARAIPRARTGALLTVPGMGPPQEELPVPPRDLWAVHDDYLAFGQRDSSTLRHLCGVHGLAVEGPLRILDFGCGTGRVLRHLVDITAAGGEVWGADLESDRIDWCRSNLSPPFRFLTLNTAPHLPFEDDYFDLIIGGSVFTHITDQDDSWLLELRRATRPGGLLYLSVMDDDLISKVQSEPGPTPYRDWFASEVVTEHDLDAAFAAGAQALAAGAGMFTIGDDSIIPNVFHSRAYLRAHWGSVLEWLDIVEEAWFKQAVVVLRKPTR